MISTGLHDSQSSGTSVVFSHSGLGLMRECLREGGQLDPPSPDVAFEFEGLRSLPLAGGAGAEGFHPMKSRTICRAAPTVVTHFTLWDICPLRVLVNVTFHEPFWMRVASAILFFPCRMK